MGSVINGVICFQVGCAVTRMTYMGEDVETAAGHAALSTTISLAIILIPWLGWQMGRMFRPSTTARAILQFLNGRGS